MAGFDVEGARKAGYSDAEIADHLAQENKFDAGGARQSGYSDADIIGHLTGATAPSTLDKVVGGVNDVVNTIGTGIVKGTTGLLGMPRSAGDAAISAAQSLGVPSWMTAIAQAQNPFKYLPTSEDLNKQIFSAPGSTGPLAMPEVNAADNPNLTIKPPILGGGSVNLGKVIDAGIQAVPSVMLGGGGVGGGMATLVPAVTSGAGGELAGQAAEGAGTPAWAQTGARILGGGLGYMAGNRAVSPVPSALTPEETRSVATAKSIDPNFPMSVYQETGRLKGVETGVSRSQGGAGPFEAVRDEQALRAQKAALESIGVTGGLNRTDPVTMGEVFAQKNAEFNAAKNTSNPVTLDNQFYKDLAGHVQNYVDNTNPSTRIPSVAKRAQDFLDRAAAPATGPVGPTVTGPEYQALRSNVGTASYNATNPEAKYALKGIRDALDNAMVRSVPPDEAAAFQQARANWSGLKTISKAAVGGTVGSRSEGNLSPSALATALKQSQGPDVYSRTTGGLNDIARMTAYLADKVPSSGTGETLARQIDVKNILNAMTGVPVVNNLLARALTGQGFGGGTLHRYLVNQSAQNLSPALVGALVGGSQAARGGP